VDGCLTPGEAGDWNWQALQAIHELNRRARRSGSVPAVTLCTGRQEPYVEVLMQAIGAHVPGIFENGCGLYFPKTYRFSLHPSITASMREALGDLKTTLQRRVVSSGMGYFQPGKEASLTLYPLPGTLVRDLHGAVRYALSPYDRLFQVQASVTCVDVTPIGIDKGTGVRWLSSETGILLAGMGGVGDSPSDLPFLRLVGLSAAPANAAPDVRAAVRYVSPHEDGDAVVDILQRWSTPG
jgi:hydroxymethylpyrimidine pyrophosphatase-like HAD family hydrolase